MRASGTLTKNTDPHQKYSSSTPADRMPMAPPAPAKPDQMAIALFRSSGGKIAVRIESVAGMARAAPMPMVARKAMTCPAVSAVEPSRAPRTKTTSPVNSAPLRPMRAPSAPAGSRMAANTRA